MFFVTLIHSLKWFEVKTFIDFFFPLDEKLEDLKARKRKIVSDCGVYKIRFLFMYTARFIHYSIFNYMFVFICNF